MNVKYIVLTLIWLITGLSCAKEDAELIVDNTSSEDCEVEYAVDVEILESSVSTLNFYGIEDNIIFTDNFGINHDFISEKRELGLWCLHSWICDSDTMQIDSFWAKRFVKTLTYFSVSANYQFQYNLYTSLNDIEPLKYSDILNVRIAVVDELFSEVSTYIIDPRTDEAASNDDLLSLDSIVIDNSVYYDVYIDSNETFEVKYNLEKGLISFKDVDNAMEFVLSE